MDLPEKMCRLIGKDKPSRTILARAILAGLPLWLLAFGSPVLLAETVHSFEDDINLFDLDASTIPTNRVRIFDGVEEEWWYVPEWHDLEALREKGVTIKVPLRKEREAMPIPGLRPVVRGFKGKEEQGPYGPYRSYSPILVRDRKDGQWRSLALCQMARAVYPVLADPFDKDLIWIGCNDGPPGLHSDYGPIAQQRSWFGAPLAWGAKRGGLAVAHLRERWVRYYGFGLHLVSSRVYDLLFEKDTVWIYGKYPLDGGPDGLSRYDRKTGQCIPIPLYRGYMAEGWYTAQISAAEDGVEVRAEQGNAHVVTWRLDKRTLRWTMPSYAWVRDQELEVRPSPELTSEVVATARREDHFRPRKDTAMPWRGRGVLTVLESKGDWLRVTLGTQTTGWVRRQDTLDTMGIFQQVLTTYVAKPDYGNDGPRFFLCRAHFYMTPEEIQQASVALRTAAREQPKKVSDFLNYIADGYYRGAEKTTRWQQQFEAKLQEIRQTTPVDKPRP